MNKIIIPFCILSILLPLAVTRGQETKEENKEVAGEIFGTPVPIGNYYFAKRTLMVFGTKWGLEPATAQQLEDAVWDNLLLSFEAYRRNIEVSDQELEEEITKTLGSEKLDFNWKENKEAYEGWLKNKLNEDSQLFGNQLKYLIQIKKLRQLILDGISPGVTEEEALQKFIDEYNTLDTELAQFENEKDAQEFYKKIKSNKGFWEKQAKDNPKLFRNPGFVSTEFLMDMWKYPKDDVHKMMQAKPGTINPPMPIYGGKFGIARVLKVRQALRSEFPKLRESYFEKIKMQKKHNGLDEWFKKFKEEANIKVYLKPPEAPKENTASPNSK